MFSICAPKASPSRSSRTIIDPPMVPCSRVVAINLFGSRCFLTEAGSSVSTRCQNTRATRSRATPDFRALFYTHNCTLFYFCIHKLTRLANNAAIIVPFISLHGIFQIVLRVNYLRNYCIYVSSTLLFN